MFVPFSVTVPCFSRISTWPVFSLFATATASPRGSGDRTCRRRRRSARHGAMAARGHLQLGSSGVAFRSRSFPISANTLMLASSNLPCLSGPTLSRKFEFLLLTVFMRFTTCLTVLGRAPSCQNHFCSRHQQVSPGAVFPGGKSLISLTAMSVYGVPYLPQLHQFELASMSGRRFRTNACASSADMICGSRASFQM